MSTDTSNVTPEEIHAYFDDELPADRAGAVAKALEGRAELSAEYGQLGGLRAVLSASTDAEARAMPAARFEQIWDEIDRAIERDERLQAEADRGVSIWTRLWTALRPARLPLLAAAGAAAVTVVVIGTGPEAPNNPDSVASVDEHETPAPGGEAPSENPAPSDTRAEPSKLAVANPGKAPAAEPTPPSELVPMPVPDSSDAEIHGIEFGGKNGRIGHTGTVTVLYVEEDDAQSTNSERSL
ncbi:MAG: hypothetical protein AB1Z98_09480 [Nannocystaceae bacterium]